MPIRIKIGLILCAALVGLALAQYAVHQFVVLPGFHALERDEAVKDAKRVVKAIQNEIHHLNNFAWDWAAWDDTYGFVENRSAGYVESNLVDETFFGNGLNVIYICDSNGRVVWGKIFDLQTRTEIRLDFFPEDALPSRHPLRTPEFTAGQPPKEISGIVQTSAGPLVVSAVPVLKSSYEGPSRGTLIMGRFLDEAMTARISDQTQVTFAVVQKTDPLPPDLVMEEGPDGMKIFFENHHTLHVHAEFPDIQGNPAMTICTRFDRKISRNGEETVRNSILLFLLAGAGIVVLVSISLKYSILKPISLLMNHVLRIKQTGDLSQRLLMRRDDEIGILARECDNMVARLEKTARENAEINQQLREDIEQRRLAETALLESEKRFRAMIDQAGDPVFLYDVAGKIRIANQAACRLLGYEPQTLLSMTIHDIEPDAPGPLQISEDREKKNFQAPEVVETRYQRRDQDGIPVEVSRAWIQYGGETLILSIARDLTERKLADAQLRQSRKMAAMATLTAGIAHNFNNLLSVILGSAELALAKLPAEHPAAALIQRIQRAGDRAKDKVFQLIRFGRIGEQPVRPIAAAAEIESQIARMESGPSPAISPDQVKIIRHLDARCRPLLNDPGELRVIMEGLLANAVESFADGRGVIEVVLEPVPAGKISEHAKDLPPDHPFVRLIVRDNGRGIDSAHLDRIFDPYFTTKNFAGGAGMGLSVIHGIVVGNGGRIKADSKVGRGAEITIILPAAEIGDDPFDPPDHHL